MRGITVKNKAALDARNKKEVYMKLYKCNVSFLIFAIPQVINERKTRKIIEPYTVLIILDIKEKLINF